MRRSSIALASLALTCWLSRPAVAAAQQPAAPAGPLTLLQAIDLGRSQGVNAAIAQLNQRAADARVGQRRADLLPSINGIADYSRQTLNLAEFGLRIPGVPTVTDPFDLYRFQVQASQTIFDASLIARLRAARDTAVAAGLDSKAAGEISGATAGIAYLQALSTRETVRAREADSAIAATLLDQAHQLVSAGVSPAIDQTRSEVSYAAVRTQLEVARNSADRSRLDLLRALNLPSGTKVELADSLGPGALDLPLNPDSAAGFAREHRAELAAERARTEAAHRSLGAMRAEYLPSLGLSGYYKESGQSTNGLDGSYTVQLELKVPILDGFRRQNRVREENLRVEIQETREHDLVNQVETEARQSVLDVASAQQQVAIAGDRLRLAEQELAQAQQRFQAGVAGSVETTNAQSSVISARDALIQARVNFGTARVGAYRALGVIDQMH